MSFFKQFPLVNYDIGLDGSITKMVNIFRSVRPIQNYIDNPSLYKFYQIENGERPDIISQKLYGTPDFYWTFFVVNEFLHDGYKVWPMSQEQMLKYLTSEYSGYAVNTRISYTDNNIQNSLAGNFKLGETITGETSGASGTLTKKNIDLNQLVIQNMTSSLSFNGRKYTSGEYDNTSSLPFEKITGSTSRDQVQSYDVWPYAEAPHHYYILDEDGTEREYTPDIFIDSQEYTKTSEELSYISNRQYVYNLNDQRSKIRVINPNMIGEFVDTFERLINEWYIKK